MLDCQTCGACCVTTGGRAYVVTLGALDVERLGIARVVGHPTHNVVALRVIDGRCAELRGSVGERVSCAVYDDRPTRCAAFVQGGADCLALRRALGVDPRES